MAVDNGTPTTSESEAGTSIEKFKTPADRDKAYLELEKLSLDQARRLSDMEKKLDDFASYVPQAPQQDQRNFTDMYPSRQDVDRKEAELAAKLLTKPTEVLADVARRAREETLQEVAVQMANMDAVNRFKSDFPDLAKHEEIVAMFVRRQPHNLTPAERLKRAAPEARKYLSEIANTNPNKQPNGFSPDVYVEAPSGSERAPQGGTTEKEPSAEEDLNDFLSSRRARQQKHRL
jgi:hypothetical protein